MKKKITIIIGGGIAAYKSLELIRHLQSQNFEVIPVPFRDAYPFGGALHCATTDVYREGSREDYFPKQ